ncbi:MAG: hypothetical protein J0M09_13405 [Xanthomonadales bacterium]|nr:hypothetical protein [Xanthomonadales bacterium]
MRPSVNNSVVIQKPGFTDRELVWLCLTSLWHRRYVENVVHIVCMPSGARVRLRYSREYVSPELWNRVSEGKALGDIVVLIALLDAQFVEPPRVEPLRRCKLISVGCQGSVIVLDVVLGDFMVARQEGNEFWEDIKKIAIKPPKKSDSDDPPSGHFLQQLTTVPTSVQRDYSIQAWEMVANSVFRIDDCVNRGRVQRHIPYLFFIAGLNNKLNSSLLNHGELVCEGGLSFSLDVHTIMREKAGKIDNPIGEVCLEVSHPAAKFITSRRVRVDSPRDVKTIQLSTSSVFRRVYGHLSIRSICFEYLASGIEDGHSIPQESEGRPSSAGNVNVYSTIMKGTNRREEVIATRYDFSLAVGRVLPWFACALVSLAAAIAVYKSPDSGNPELSHFAQPALVFLVALLGLRIGLRGEKA